MTGSLLFRVTCVAGPFRLPCFPMYEKENEFRYNHHQENIFKLFLMIYFGCVPP